MLLGSNTDKAMQEEASYITPDLEQSAREQIADSDNRSCLHCGASLITPSTSHASPGYDEQFCCKGCKFVYSNIIALGLTHFYKYRDNVPCPVPFIPGSKQFDSFDTPEFIAAHVTVLSNNHHRGVFALQGMHCVGCVWLIEHLPKILPGVISAKVNFSTGQILVEYNSNMTSLSKIAAILDSLGYQLQVTTPEHSSSGKSETRQELLRLGVAAVCAMNSMMLAVSLYQGLVTGIESEFSNYFRWASVVVSLPAVIYSAWPFYTHAWMSLRSRMFHIDLPISIAIIGAFGMSFINTLLGRENVYFDSVTALIFLLLVGRLVQARALRRARIESRFAWSILPEIARKVEGKLRLLVPVSSLTLGSLIEVLPGERIPADGIIRIGRSSIDSSILTGESLPAEVELGETVYAGTLNVDGAITIETIASAGRTRIGRLLAELDNYGLARAKILQLTDRTSAYFVGIVLTLSIVTFCYWLAVNPLIAIDRTVALLIVTCPCALGLATPLALGISIARAAKAGILIKGTDTIERLSRVRHVYLDKTGTLTEGKLAVVRSEIIDSTTAPPLDTIGRLANFTPQHPVSRAVASWVSNSNTLTDRLNTQELGVLRNFPARGSEYLAPSGELWRLGSARWMQEVLSQHAWQIENLTSKFSADGLSPLFLSLNNKLVLLLGLEDTLRPGGAELITILKSLSIRPYILSGDSQSVVNRVAHALSIPLTDARGAQYPEDKAAVVSADPTFTAMIGDGVNDCAALKSADVSVGVRGGIEVNLEVADVFVTDPSPETLSGVFLGATRTMQVIKRNLVFSVAYNIFGGTLAILGYVNPLVAAILMPISSITVITSSIISQTFVLPKKAR